MGIMVEAGRQVMMLLYKFMQAKKGGLNQSVW